MKKTVTTLLATAALISAAQAADLPSRKAPVAPPPPAFTWTGVYVGANVGGGWKSNGNGQVYGYNPVTWQNIITQRNGNGNAGVIGGIQAGYNWQVGSMLVAGVETDFQGSTISGGSNGAYNVAAVNALYPGWVAGYTGGTNVNWFGTVRGRVGVVPLMPTLLVYGTGGFAYGNVSSNGTYGGQNATQTGWTVGGGAEWAFAPAWSVKAEYLYTDISGGNQKALFNSPASLNNVNNSTKFNTVRAGVNYHFNTSDVLPTLAKF